MKKIAEEIDPELIEILIHIVVSYRSVREQLVERIPPEAISFLLNDNFREIFGRTNDNGFCFVLDNRKN